MEGGKKEEGKREVVLEGQRKGRRNLVTVSEFTTEKER